MTKLTYQSREGFTKPQLYRMMNGADNISIKDVSDNTLIQCEGYIKFTDTKDDGSESELVSVLADTGEIYTTQSTTFICELENIVDFMETDAVMIKKLSGTTKAGRPFVTCTLAE